MGRLAKAGGPAASPRKRRPSPSAFFIRKASRKLKRRLWVLGAGTERRFSYIRGDVAWGMDFGRRAFEVTGRRGGAGHPGPAPSSSSVGSVLIRTCRSEAVGFRRRRGQARVPPDLKSACDNLQPGALAPCKGGLKRSIFNVLPKCPPEGGLYQNPLSCTLSRLVPLGVEHAFLVGPAVGMRAKIVALRLEQVGRQPLLAVAVEIGERRAQGEAWRAQVRGRLHDFAQAVCALVEETAEVGVEHEVVQIGFRAKRRAYGVEEFGADDAPAFPDPRHLVQFQFVLVFLRSPAELRKALGVAGAGRDLARLLQAREEALLVARKLPRRAAADFRRCLPFFPLPGQDAGLDRGGECGHGHAE